MIRHCQIGQLLQDIIVPIATCIVGGIISGVATFKAAKWQTAKKEKHDVVETINTALTELQTTTISNFYHSIERQLTEEDIIKTRTAYAVNFKIITTKSIYLTPPVKKVIDKYLELTHHNIRNWVEKNTDIQVSPHIEENTGIQVSPYVDQAIDGKAKKAYDSAIEALSKWYNN